jgi:hypothetical protein
VGTPLPDSSSSISFSKASISAINLEYSLPSGVASHSFSVIASASLIVLPWSISS